VRLSNDLRRWGGLAAVVGGIVGLLYWPLHSLAYFATEDGRDSEGLLQPTEWLRKPLEPLLDWSSPDTVYVTYGAIVVLPAVGFLLGLLAVHVTLPERPTRLERWGFRVAVAGNVVAILGVVVEYWLQQVDVGFAIGAPGLVILLVGSTLFGIGLLRARAVPRAGPWLLALSIPLVLACTILIGHLSAGLIPLDVAWIALGWWAWSLAPVAEPDALAHTPV
jgi:hypothetical protein